MRWFTSTDPFDTEMMAAVAKRSHELRMIEYEAQAYRIADAVGEMLGG